LPNYYPQEKKVPLRMSFQTDGTLRGDMLNKLHLTSTASSKTRDGRRVARSVDGSTSSLDRALRTLSRDSALRREYLHARWQGATENQPSNDKPKLYSTDLEFWWRKRLQTALGRALRRLK
jgi:hypothetical protein